jgi:tellurite resistance protein TerC
MIAGASITFWLCFHAAVLAILLVDSFWMQRGERQPSTRASAVWTVIIVLLALSFAGFLYAERGHQAALEFISGYAIELSLSIDNLFVFLLLFRSFGLPIPAQRQALTWGVAGAIVMRGIFIFAGVALLQRFLAVEYLFGAILLYAAIRLLLQKESHTQPKWVQWLAGRKKRGPSLFFLAVLAIEVTDLIFAIDSVPAVIAVSHETFIIYTSNICAILGLRSLYFVLADMLHKLRLLHYGLGLILAFVGVKMLIGHWVEIPITVSLAVILGILAVFTAASLLLAQPAAKTTGQP